MLFVLTYAVVICLVFMQAAMAVAAVPSTTTASMTTTGMHFLVGSDVRKKPKNYAVKVIAHSVKCYSYNLDPSPQILVFNAVVRRDIYGILRSYYPKTTAIFTTCN